MTNYSCYVDSGADTYGVNGTSLTCQIHRNYLTCDAGYYNATLSADSAPTYDNEKTVTALLANACVTVGSGYYSPADSVTRSTCPSGYSGSDGTREANTNCYASCSPKTIDNGTTTVVNEKEYYDGSAYPACTFNVNCNATYGASGNKTTSPTCTACTTGQYSAGGTATCRSCPADYRSGAAASSQSNCKTSCSAGTYVATAKEACVNVGVGFYAPGGSVAYGSTSTNRGQCASGLTTIGYGTGANEAADCGRKLHAGNNTIYLRSAERSTPSLRVKVGDTTFYGALSTSLSGALKVKNGSTTYSVVNDWQ